MATIIQPYDPWAEKAAVNVLGGLINGLLQRHWENEDNRKMNAFRGAVMAELDKKRGLTPQLQGQATLEGYDTNPWARASQTMPDNALSQFDALAQADNLPKYDISKTGAVPIQSLQSPITIQDMQDAIVRTMASQPRRWSRLNPQRVQAEFLPYMQAMEQGRQEQLRNDLADSYGQAQDAAGRRDVLMRGAINGYIPESMATQGQKMYEYDNPYTQPYSFNTGDKTLYGGFNPRTGEYTQQGSYTNNLTPQQIAENAYKNRELSEKSRQFNAELGEKRRQFDLGQAYDREGRAITQDQWQQEYNLKVGEQASKAIQQAGTLTETQKGQIKSLENRRDSYVKQLDTLRKQRSDELKNGGGYDPYTGESSAEGSSIIKDIDAKIAEIEKKIDNCNTQIDAIYAGTGGSGTSAGITQQSQANQLKQDYDKVTNELKQKQEAYEKTTDPTARGVIEKDIKALKEKQSELETSINQIGTFTPSSEAANTPVWTSMVQGAKGSGYGARGTSFHSGVDIKATKGSPIKVPKDLGVDTFTVKKVFTSDPVNGGGYGNHVELEGEVNGHKVGITVAHMQNGSIPLKEGQQVSAGEIIGKVGNTGRTGNDTRGIGNWYEGKDYGYHMHLTVSVDGHRIDPENYYKEIAPKGTRQQSTYNDNSPVMWRNPNTGEILTRKQYFDIVQRAGTGQIPGTNSILTVDKNLERKGYKKVDENSSDSSSQGNAQTAGLSMDVQPTQSTASGDVTPAPVTSPTAATDLRPSYQKMDYGQALTMPSQINAVPTSVEVANQATNADIQAGVNKLNGVEELTSWGVYPAGFLA